MLGADATGGRVGRIQEEEVRKDDGEIQGNARRNPKTAEGDRGIAEDKRRA